MSGITESPPTYYFSGITFNPNFYTTSGDYITKTSGRKYFLSYPTAQGTETVSTLYASTINSPNSGIFNFLESQTSSINIGNTTTGTSGQTIKIGPTATTKIEVGDINITGSSINNATNSTSRGVKIGDAQTDSSADLNLGTHINRLGDINIGTGNTNATPLINIGGTTGTGSIRAGATINIGRMTTNPITIGNSSADVTISCASGSIKTNAFACTTQTASGLITANGGITIPSGKTLTANGGLSCTTQSASGLITANGGLTLGSGQGITFSSTGYLPTSTQLGYTLYGESNVEVTVTPTSRIIATITDLPVGVYHVTCYCTLYTFTIGATQVVTMSDSSTGGIATSPSIPKTVVNGVSTTFQTTPTLGGIVRATSNTNTLQFNIIMTSGGGQCFMSNYGYYAIKIA